MEASMLLTPDWVMVGYRATEEGTGREFHYVVASDRLTHGALRAQQETWDFLSGMLQQTVPVKRWFELKVNMGTVRMAWGWDYAEALQALFGEWKPSAPTPELQNPTPELTERMTDG